MADDELLTPLRALEDAVEEESHSQPHRFIQRFRLLVVGAYFSSEMGVAELGYAGNIPIAGDYPGPSVAAQQHLSALLDELGLTL